MNTVICPHCKKPVEISQAIRSEIEEKTLADVSSKHQKELEAVKKAAEEAAFKKASDELTLKLKNTENEAEEIREKNRKQQEELLALSKMMRELKEKDGQRALEMEKTLAIEEEKIRKQAVEKAEEQQHLKLLEKDKQIENALKEVEDMRRKLQQGSQQMQGEAFELEFEETLKKEFPNDVITEVAKGTRGGDLIQEVWDRNGNSCGKVLWELKNTKTWSEGWIEKLKGDQRSAGAEFAVIISEVVPDGIESAKYYKNVWVCKRSFVLGLANSLRLSLIQLAMARRASEGKKEKMDIMYSYLSGTEFRLRIEAIVESFTNMQTEIEKEKRYFTNKWARDEKNIRTVIDNTYGMHGDLKGIMGNVLPEMKGLDQLESGHEE